MSKTQAIAKREDPGQLAQLPEHLREYSGQQLGFESADQSDFILPRLGLCQSLSPQRKKGDAVNFIAGLEEGEFFNTVSKERYGARVTVIPLFLTKQRIKFNEPIGSGIDCQSTNGVDGGRLSKTCAECPHSRFGEDGPPACTEFKNLVSFLPQHGGIIVVSLKSSSLKVAKQWLSQMRMLNVPMFARAYHLSSVDETKNNNTYKQFLVTPGEYAEPKFFEQARAYFEALRQKNIVVDTTGIEEESEEFNTTQM